MKIKEAFNLLEKHNELCRIFANNEHNFIVYFSDFDQKAFKSFKAFKAYLLKEYTKEYCENALSLDMQNFNGSLYGKFVANGVICSIEIFIMA